MTVSRHIAKTLCTKVEFDLGNESFSPHVEIFNRKALQARIRRARAARDKQRTLAMSQAREMSGRTEPTRSKRATNNHNTLVKQQFFEETLTRYQRQLEKLEKKERAEALKAKVAAKKAATRGKGVKPKKTLEAQEAKRISKATNKRNAGQPATAGFKANKVNPNLPAMRGATRAAHRRSQARRDSRR